MDEDEIDEYYDLVFGKDNPFEDKPFELLEQVRDDDYYRVPGCYRKVPAPTE